METTTVKPHLWTDGGSKVLLLKRIDKDGTTRDGKFPYPQVGGIVTAPDFNSTHRCGNGIHWWPWGMGLGDGMDYDIIDDIWLVGAELPDKIIGELDGREKCKTQRAEIVYRGSFAGAWAMVNSGRHRLIEAMAKAASGNSSRSVASGYSSSSAASGYSSHSAASGYSSRSAASGNSSRSAASGDYSNSAASGYSSRSAASGNYSSSAASGYSSSSAASGYSSHSAASGDYSSSAASGDSSNSASSGNSSRSASSGDYSSSAASGNYSSAMANGFYSRARCGPNGCFAILWWDGLAKRLRIAVGEAGIDGIKPDTWYEVKNGKLVECTKEQHVQS